MLWSIILHACPSSETEPILYFNLLTDYQITSSLCKMSRITPSTQSSEAEIFAVDDNMMMHDSSIQPTSLNGLKTLNQHWPNPSITFRTLFVIVSRQHIQLIFKPKVNILEKRY